MIHGKGTYYKNDHTEIHGIWNRNKLLQIHTKWNDNILDVPV